MYHAAVALASVVVHFWYIFLAPGAGAFVTPKTATAASARTKQKDLASRS